MAEEYDPIESVLDKAMEYASERSHEYVVLEHLLLALLNEKEIQSLITDVDGDIEQIMVDCMEYLDSKLKDIVVESSDAPRKTAALERAFNRAVTQVIFSGRKKLTIKDIFVSLLSEKNSYALYFLKKNKVTRQSIIEQLTKERYGEDVGLQERQQGGEPGGGIRFEDYCTDLNKEAKEGRIDTLIGREPELDDIVHILARRKKNNCIVVGEPGVGKTAIAEGIAKKIVDKQVPDAIKDKTVYSLDVASLVAGTKFRGDFEERAKVVLEKLQKQKDVILFIDEVHMIMGAGSAGQSNMDFGTLLKPILAKGKLLCIGTTTIEEYRENFEKDRALMRRFQRLDLGEPSKTDAKLILNGILTYYEKFHQAKYDEGCVDLAVDLADRFIHNKFLPDKAIDVIDAAGAKAKLAQAPSVTKHMIQQQVSKISNVPMDVIDEKQTDNYAGLEGKVKTKVYGQNEAIEKLVDSIMIAKAGLRPDNKPIGSYLFVGPTGVGKTEVCRQLADSLGIKLLKYDMSEYQERHSVSKLIGAPPGYVGYAEGSIGSGQLINDVEDNPNCVLLLDEVEKSAPEVLQVLLQVMDDGKLTSSTGKTVMFNKVILCLTSNLGAQASEKPPMGIGVPDSVNKTDDYVKDFFAPEFRNRLDATIQFNKLSKDNILKIVHKVKDETNAMLKDKNVIVVLDDTAAQWIADEGFDPAMGARPMQRIFDQSVKRPLSKEILFGKLINGGTVIVKAVNNKLELEYQQ
jgi:ATP-dependent Clp protease ATP-binding subunit ClpA